jgi:pantothenate kinase-related protein Tda10
MSHDSPLVIGIAGGSGSGKTTVAKEILDRVGASRIAFLQHDSYYKDLSGLPTAQRVQVNFDHPNSLESELRIAHIHDLELSPCLSLLMILPTTVAQGEFHSSAERCHRCRGIPSSLTPNRENV